MHRGVDIQSAGLAGPHRPEQAWQLVHDFLCSPVSAALPIFVKASVPPVTLRISDPANNEDSQVKDIAEELRRSLPAGRAWSPQARLEKRDLVVYYSIHGTCWNFFGSRFVGERWRLVLLGGGCD